VLIDDAGFATSSAFGGGARTPVLEQLAGEGLRYNRFHTTGICSPTRASLLTGRNHHQVGFGNLADIPAGFPAYNTIWKQETASLPRILQLGGYSTAAFGKWHNTPRWEVSQVGPSTIGPRGWALTISTASWRATTISGSRISTMTRPRSPIRARPNRAIT
jgi:arylsulfatase